MPILSFPSSSRPAVPRHAEPTTSSPASTSKSVIACNVPQPETHRPPTRAQTRVFSMTNEEAEEKPNVITGIMSIFHNDARILIDSGSDKSFISSAFACLADRALSPLKYPLVVQTPLQEEILKSVEFKECKVGEVELEANLIPLELWDFDVILGMDWLKKY